ncbi:hypothetical protein Tco_0313315 [Tanacetum coccineum]
MPTIDSYLAANVTMLNTRRTPIQKQPEALLCLVGLSRNYLLGDDEYPTFLYDDGREMDLFNLISAPNPSKVKTGSRPRAAHEVPLLTVTANRVIEMKDPSVASGSSGTPSTVKRSPLDFDNENRYVRILQKSQENSQNRTNTNTGTDRVHKSREFLAKVNKSPMVNNGQPTKDKNP